MEDIIALKVTTEDDRNGLYFLTWGRIFDRIDDTEIIEVLSQNLNRYGIYSYLNIELCDSLVQASRERYFYEHFFSMCQKKIEFGTEYEKWREAKKKDLLKGKEIYFLGRAKESS